MSSTEKETIIPNKKKVWNGRVLNEFVKQMDDHNYNLTALTELLNDDVLDKEEQHNIGKLVKAYFYETDKKEKSILVCSLISAIMNCQWLFVEHEKHLPPVVNSKSDVNESYRETCDLWANKVYASLDEVATFDSKRVKDTVFISLLLDRVANDERRNQYRLVLYCVG